MTQTRDNRAVPPPGLAADRAIFYKAGHGMDRLQMPGSLEPRHTLERLGPAPFRKTGFPLLGFLATVYDHVSQQTGSVATIKAGSNL